MIFRKFPWYSEKLYDIPKIYKNSWKFLVFFENLYDFPKISMIVRKFILFFENFYDFSKIYYFLKKDMIFRKNIWFFEKKYMIFRELLWFNEIFYAFLNYYFDSFWHDFMLNQVQLTYRRSSELLASTTIIQYGKFKILHEIMPALERHGVLRDNLFRALPQFWCTHRFFIKVGVQSPC